MDAGRAASPHLSVDWDRLSFAGWTATGERQHLEGMTVRLPGSNLIHNRSDFAQPVRHGRLQVHPACRFAHGGVIETRCSLVQM